jgi:protein-L-isoaspartate(D-aspartate) O-methyltransferase
MDNDSYVFAGKRVQLANILKKKGIRDVRVLNAIKHVPRHMFVDSGLILHAYSDKALRIDSGQTISQPYTVAFQTELLEISEGDKVLEIGTGSGYQAAVLYDMGAKVYSVERFKDLHEKAKKVLRSLHYRVRLFHSDGFEGLDGFAPFDKIIITAGAPEIPKKLLLQLKVNGIMVLPLTRGDDSQEMLRIIKLNERDFEMTRHGKFQFVPMLHGKL